MLGEQPVELPRANSYPSGKSFDTRLITVECTVSDKTGGRFCGGDAPTPRRTERGGFRSASKARTKPGCFGGSRTREKLNISSQCLPGRAHGSAIDARGSNSAEKHTVIRWIAAHPGSFAFGMVEHGKTFTRPHTLTRGRSAGGV
jgi:hypothetical protein